MRGSRWIAVIAVAPLLLSTAPAQASASHTGLTRLSVAATPLTALVGTHVAITGTAAPKAAGETVALQRLVNGQWRRLGHTATTKTGRYAFSLRVPRSAATWVVRVAGTGAASKAVHLRVVKTAFHVHAAAARTVAAGAAVVVTGTVTPKSVGKVQLQAVKAGAWHTVATEGLTKTSTFKLSAVEPVGVDKLRVVRPFTATIAGGVSKTLAVTVLAPPGGTPTTPPPTTPPAPGSPTVTVTLDGTVASPGVYTGSVTVTLTAGAAAGIHSVSYSLDGGATTQYTTPFVVSALSSHYLIATATDTGGLVGTAYASWTQHAASSGNTDDFTQGGTVSASCQVTGFDGVLPNTGGTQCLAGNIKFVPAGLQLTSTAGQLANDNQQNALYKTFNASAGSFTVKARVVGGVNQISQNYQQLGAFFGPDQDHFVKVEAEHNMDAAPHLTMYFRDPSSTPPVNTTLTTVIPAGLATATTLDLVIKSAADALSVYYSINGGALVQVGTARTPAVPATWFTSASKAGIEVSNSGTTTAVVATYSSFGIS